MLTDVTRTVDVRTPEMILVARIDALETEVAELRDELARLRFYASIETPPLNDAQRAILRPLRLFPDNEHGLSA